MPPKKQKDDEIDVSTLPPWFAVNCVLKCQGKKTRMQSFLNLLKTHPKSFTRNITREEIIEFAKEKGLYTDPNTLNEKQKKDPKTLESLNLELTPAVIAKAFAAFRTEVDIKNRKAKKDKLEGKEEVDDKKVDPKKKDVKKETKKGAKGAPVEVPKEEEEKKEEVEPEKEYKKALDAIYFLFDFPQIAEDMDALSKIDAQVDLIFDIREKVLWNNQDPDMSLLDHKENFEEDMKQRMDDFIDGGDETEGHHDDGYAEGEGEEKQPKQKKEVLEEEDLAYIKESKDFVARVRQNRAESSRTSTLRKTVIKEAVFEIDPTAQEESFKNFIDYLLEEICQFSFDLPAFNEWMVGKKQAPLCPKEALIQQQLEEEKNKELARIQAEQAQAALEEAENLKKKGGKKEAKKETKKDGKKEESKPDEAEAKPVEQAPPKPEEPPKPTKEPFFQYYKQLNDVNLQKTTAGILLECILDEIQSEKLEAQEQVLPKEKEEFAQVNQILANLSNFVDYTQSNTLANYTKQLNLDQIDKNTPYKSIIDECDEIEKRTHNAFLGNLDQVSQREHSLFSELLFPGIDRNAMPEIPEKSEPLRKAEKSQLYPFIGCSVYEFERRLILTRFEEMMKEVEPEREWNFGNRVYMERHNRNTLSQQLYKAMLYEPSIITKYNDKDDSLQVALYFKNPPGRILRKKWSAEWKVIPNLENWINFFKNSESNLKNETYYDLDYELIGNLHERTKYMFPNDNSVIFGTKFQVADTFHYRYKVMKEGVTFGIKEQNGQPNFWALLDSNTQLFVELENNQKALPSSNSKDQNQHNEENNEVPQEHHLEEDLKAAITLTLVNGLVVKFLPNGDVFQTKIEQDKRSLVRDFEDIVNPHEAPKANSETEIKRIITGKGSVIKYMKDGSTYILYANGNVSFSQQRNGNWITTNNKGLRKMRNARDGTETEQEAIPCAKRTDPESGSKIVIRGDQTTIVTYKDGSVYTKHKDGTEMFTSPKKDVTTVEHPDFSTVRVLFDEVKARTDTVIGLGSAYANVGFESLFERSNNGIIVETYLPDGTKVIGYQEKQELPGYNQFQTNHIHLIYFEDGSVSKVLDNGEIVFISAVDRVQLNAIGAKHTFGQDIDYWLQLFCVPEERKAGVYSTSLINSSLWTRDDEGNVFTLRSNGDIDTKIAVSLNLNQNNPDPGNPLDRPQTPDFQEGEFIEEENKFLPQPSSWVPVRLFCIQNDNTGFELLSKEQVSNYFRLKEQDSTCIKLVDETVPNYENCKSISFISQLLTIEDKKQTYIKPVIPRNLDIIPKTEKKRTEPEKKSYLYRNFLEFQEFGADKREQHKQELEKYDLWKKEQNKQSNEYGIIQKSEAERDAEFKIQLQILESRKREYKDEKFEDFKEKMMNVFLPRSDWIIGKHKELTIQELQVLGSPRDSTQQQDFKRSDIRTQTQIERDLKLEQIKNKAKDKTQESLKNQKRKDYFVTNYFETEEGTSALNAMPKDIFNPVVVMNNLQDTNKKDMDELKRRGQEIEADQYNSTFRNSTQKLSTQQARQDDHPVVQLEAEQEVQRADPRNQQRTIVIKPSVFTQRDIDEEKLLIEKEREALGFRKVKTKEYNVYGTERRGDQTKKVPCLLKTSPISELNQKYILTDSLTDKRVKVASMATRMYLNAPSISENRNAGTHQNLAKTIDKKYNIDDLENKKNLMITADLNDQLRKDLSLTPASARFGVLCANRIYETKLILKNEDVLAQRVVLKQPQTQYVKVFLSELGAIPMGLTREVIIRLNTSSDIVGKFHEDFQVVSKHQIYKIPIFANILEQQEFDELEKETKELHSKPLLKTFVKEIEFNKRRDQKSIGNDSQQSDLFPKLNNFDRSYKIDPSNNMNNKAGGKDHQDSFDQSFAD